MASSFTRATRFSVVCDHCRKVIPAADLRWQLDECDRLLRITARCHGAVDECVIDLNAVPRDFHEQVADQVGHAFTESNPQQLTKGAPS